MLTVGVAANRMYNPLGFKAVKEDNDNRHKEEGHCCCGHDSVSPGVTDATNDTPPAYVVTGQEAARIAADMAVKAANQGTFGVGGILVGPDGRILAYSRNHVLSEEGKVVDPTAHGERQLVDWYFEQLHNGADLPAPEKCTIVSSLDPCIMCTGTILKAGMNVTVLAPDELNGVDYRKDGQYSTLPEELRPKAQNQFAYLGVEGSSPFRGSPTSIFVGQEVSRDLEQRSTVAFAASLDSVKAVINNQGDLPPDRLRNPRELLEGEAPHVLEALRRYAPEALSVQTDPQRPGVELAPLLRATADKAAAQGNAHDAAALIDPFGNVLLAAGGQESVSPTRTAFMELTRTWTKIRNEAGPEGRKFLPHLKHCKVVTLMGPGREPTNLMEIGAFGSSVEGPLPENTLGHWHYVVPRQPQEQLNEMLASLPPLYSEIIRPDIRQVEDQALRDAVK